MCFYNYIDYRASALKELLLLGLAGIHFSVQAQQKVGCYCTHGHTIRSSLDRK